MVDVLEAKGHEMYLRGFDCPPLLVAGIPPLDQKIPLWGRTRRTVYPRTDILEESDVIVRRDKG